MLGVSNPNPNPIKLSLKSKAWPYQLPVYLFSLIGNQEIVSETCDMVARKLVPKCVNIDDTFSEYNDEDDEDILGLRAAEGDFNIPVCE